MRTLIKLLVGVVLLAAIGVGVWWFFIRDNKPPSSYRVAQVKRGELLATITATGTVVPEEVVDVGAQVAGRILSFGVDPSDPNKEIDYNTIVKEGTVLATIDEAVYSADVDSAKAAVTQANANVRRAEADISQMKAKLYQAERDWQRAQKVGPSDALSQNDYDLYQANFESAKANLIVAEAAVEQAKGGVAQAEATLKKATRNLEFCVIKSPVDGVVIDRRVGIGQTVVSSLNTPSLFLLAKDLKRMEVWSPVNEADVGSIAPGQKVSFTVDSRPGETFKGEVGKIRLNAQITQNVVTYTVEITTDNSTGRLMPYTTASVKFEVNRKRDVLQVPNAALRWAPRPEQIAPEAREAYAASQQQQGQRRGGPGGPGGGGGAPAAGGPGAGAPSGGGGRPGGAGAAGASAGGDGGNAAARPAGDGAAPSADAGAAADAGAPHPRGAGGPTTRESRAPRTTRGTVWIQDGVYVKPISVRVGLTDNTYTEVQGEGLEEGANVVIGENRPEDAAAAGPGGQQQVNPFTPQFPRGGSGGGGGGRRGG